MARDYAPLLTEIVAIAVEDLEASGARPGRVVISPGTTPAADECCDGLLYLRVVEVFPTSGFKQSSPFPAMDVTQLGVGCGINLLALHLAIGVWRCAATPDNSGKITPAAITADGLEMVADMAVLLDTIECQLKQQIPEIQALKIDRWTPLAEQGGCHGGEWPFYIAVDPCIPCANGG